MSLAGLEPRQDEHAFDQLVEVVQVVPDDIQIPGSVLAVEMVRVQTQGLDVAAQAGQGSAQVVAHIGDELTLKLLLGAEFLHHGLQAPGHGVEMPSEGADFVRAAVGDAPVEIPAGEGFHPVGQFADAPAGPGHDDHGGQNHVDQDHRDRAEAEVGPVRIDLGRSEGHRPETGGEIGRRLVVGGMRGNGDHVDDPVFVGVDVRIQGVGRKIPVVLGHGRQQLGVDVLDRQGHAVAGRRDHVVALGVEEHHLGAVLGDLAPVIAQLFGKGGTLVQQRSDAVGQFGEFFLLGLLVPGLFLVGVVGLEHRGVDPEVVPADAQTHHDQEEGGHPEVQAVCEARGIHDRIKRTPR